MNEKPKPEERIRWKPGKPDGGPIKLPDGTIIHKPDSIWED